MRMTLFALSLCLLCRRRRPRRRERRRISSTAPTALKAKGPLAFFDGDYGR